MYKKLLVYFFIIILSVSIVFGNSNESLKPEEAIEIAFNESEAKFDHVNINSYVVIKNTYISIDNAIKICDDISEKLGFNQISLEKESGENYCLISANGTLEKEQHAVIIIQSSKVQDLEESSIVIDITQTKQQYDLKRLCDKIREALIRYGKVNLNINLQGYYDGFIYNKDLEKKINKILRSIQATQIEGINEDDLISITGYTPSIDEYMSYCGKKANINIAGRYSSYEGRTHIWIGTPLIILEY